MVASGAALRSSTADGDDGNTTDGTGQVPGLTSRKTGHDSNDDEKMDDNSETTSENGDQWMSDSGNKGEDTQTDMTPKRATTGKAPAKSGRKASSLASAADKSPNRFDVLKDSDSDSDNDVRQDADGASGHKPEGAGRDA
jgi:hypothetical protein